MGGFLFGDYDDINQRPRGAQAGFRRVCSTLPERIRACKREDREISAP